MEGMVEESSFLVSTHGKFILWLDMFWNYLTGLMHVWCHHTHAIQSKRFFLSLSGCSAKIQATFWQDCSGKIPSRNSRYSEVALTLQQIDSSKDQPRPNNFCKEAVNFPQGHRFDCFFARIIGSGPIFWRVWTNLCCSVNVPWVEVCMFCQISLMWYPSKTLAGSGGAKGTLAQLTLLLRQIAATHNCGWKGILLHNPKGVVMTCFSLTWGIEFWPFCSELGNNVQT